MINNDLKKIYQKSKEDFYQELSEWLIKKSKKIIITANPETFMISEKDQDLKKILSDSNNSLVPDGIAIVKACQKLGINIKERITGIEICEYLLNLANENSYSLYLFGAKEEVIEKLVKKIQTEYPNIKLLGYQNGYIKNKDEMMEKIVKKNPDICLVALGIPEQEKTIARHIKEAKKGIYIGVGGSFDVLSGVKKRAPKLFIKLKKLN